MKKDSCKKFLQESFLLHKSINENLYYIIKNIIYII